MEILEPKNRKNPTAQKNRKGKKNITEETMFNLESARTSSLTLKIDFIGICDRSFVSIGYMSHITGYVQVPDAD